MSVRATALAIASAAMLLAGCAAGTDAVAGGQDFQFVAPGGQTKISYDPPASRHAVPGITGDSLTEQGRRLGVDDYPGKVVVLNLWGSWCGPCRAEAPLLQTVADRTASDPVQVLGIDLRDDRSAATDFVTDRRLTYPSIFDPPGRSLLALHGYPRNIVPSTIVLDRNHRVAQVFLAQVDPTDLLPVIHRLTAESP
jgi:thiol-disulfide isomerase/thioredoxin